MFIHGRSRSKGADGCALRATDGLSPASLLTGHIQYWWRTPLVWRIPRLGHLSSANATRRAALRVAMRGAAAKTAGAGGQASAAAVSTEGGAAPIASPVRRATKAVTWTLCRQGTAATAATGGWARRLDEVIDEVIAEDSCDADP